MKCAYHSEADALGMCNGCGKAICEDCSCTYEGEIYCSRCFEVSHVLAKVEVSNRSPVGFVIGSIVCAALALVWYSHLFGPAGIVLGYFTFRRNRAAGILCMAISSVCMVAGFLFL